MIAELAHLLGDEVEGRVEHNVRRGDRRLDHGRVAPVVELVGLIRPDDRAVRAAALHDAREPCNGFLVDEVVAAVKSVLVGEDNDLLPRLDLRALIDHVVQGDQCVLGDA